MSASIEDQGVATTTTSNGDGSRNLKLALVVIATAQLMVVLDASIVNVALPSIQRALHFSPANLEWVINGYTLAFGGLLLLGGRTGDLFGRRRMFMIGLSLFAFASLLGGFATTEWWLIAARALQGVGGAIAAPTALSLVASTFPEGPQRNRAMGVYAAMSGVGAAVGVLLGGILTDALSWRWVLFVNVPIGAFVVLMAPRVLKETEARPGRLDLGGALTATAGMTLVVYGLIHASGHSWGEAGTVVPLVVGVLLLCAFLLVELRSRHPLMPLHLFSNRNRSGAYAMMLAIGTAMFAFFFFLTLFMQNILGFSPIRAGLAYLPFALMIMVSATLTSNIVGRVGVKVPLMVGSALGAIGLFWFSQLTPSSSYGADIIGPMLLASTGLAMCFVPLTLSAVSGVRRDESGIAAALLNSGQQVGGSLGLAILGTVAATVTRNQFAHLGGAIAGAASRGGAGAQAAAAHLPPAAHQAVNQAVTNGYTTALGVGSAILAFAFLLAVFVIRVRPSEVPVAQPGATGEAQPATAT
jgi:EmrB/QacA subfamily drug resistance transporter